MRTLQNARVGSKVKLRRKLLHLKTNKILEEGREGTVRDLSSVAPTAEVEFPAVDGGEVIRVIVLLSEVEVVEIAPPSTGDTDINDETGDFPTSKWFGKID